MKLTVMKMMVPPFAEIKLILLFSGALISISNQIFLILMYRRRTPKIKLLVAFGVLSTANLIKKFSLKCSYGFYNANLLKLYKAMGLLTVVQPGFCCHILFLCTTTVH